MRNATQAKASKDYHREIVLDVSPEQAFKGIAQVNKWWAKKFDGRAEKLNDVFTVRFGETFVTFRVSECVVNSRVAWDVTDCYLHWLSDKTEWTGTKVLWEIEEKADGTEIRFTHIGLRPEIECFAACQRGWDEHMLGSLPLLLTKGKGQPI